jgi:hypothetical protein
MRLIFRLIFAATVFAATLANAQQEKGEPRDAQIQLLRSVYKELINTNTTDSVGDNTRAATNVLQFPSVTIARFEIATGLICNAAASVRSVRG